MIDILNLGARPEAYVVVGFAAAFAADMLGKAIRMMVSTVAPGGREIDL